MLSVRLRHAERARFVLVLVGAVLITGGLGGWGYASIQKSSGILIGDPAWIAWTMDFLERAWVGLLVGGGVSVVAACVIRRPRASGCRRCSYDRKGLAANAPCPECGLVP